MEQKEQKSPDDSTFARKERGRCCDTDPTRTNPPSITNLNARDLRPRRATITVTASTAHNCGIQKVWIYPKKVTVGPAGVDVFNSIPTGVAGEVEVKELEPTSPCDPADPAFTAQSDFAIQGLYAPGDTAAFEIIAMSCCGVATTTPGQMTNQIAI